MIWKDVPGYEGLYQVSNTGLVKGHHGKVLSPFSAGNGYWKIQLYNQEGKKKAYIHRLVAMAFIPNPDNKPYINHKDNNPANNSVENLEWCTPRENFEWMKMQGRNVRTESWLNNLHKAQERYYKAVKATNIDTGEVLIFKSLNSVKNSGFQPSCVCNCCKGERYTHAGYRWEYANEINLTK